MDPSPDCAQIHKFRCRAMLHTAHLTPARGTVINTLLITACKAKGKWNGSSLASVQTVQQLPERSWNAGGRGRVDQPFWAGNQTDKPKAGDLVCVGFFVV